MRIEHILFIQSSDDGHLDCHPLLAIVKGAAKNQHPFKSAFNYFGYLLRSGIVESRDKSA